MPRLSNEQINSRVRAAMTAPIQQGLAPNTMESLMQKARQRRAPGAKMTDGQKVDLKARGM